MPFGTEAPARRFDPAASVAPDDDATFALELAAAAGCELLDLRAKPSQDAASLRAAGDARAQAFLAEALSRARPHDAVLSEEAVDDTRRLRADRVWIVDPLDGTREYAEPGRTDWAVHVALWQRGRLVAGAVALPAAGLLFGTATPPRLPERSGSPIRLAVSRTRPPRLVNHLAERLGAELVPMGSAGVKAMSVLRGEADAYVHAGGQYEWDSAAPVAVALAAGAHVSRLDGSPMLYNRPDPLLPDLVVCRPEIADGLLVAIAEAEEEGAA